MERALNKKVATFGDALRRAEGMQCLSYREQAKTYWRLSRFFLGADIPYRRMRKLLLFRELPVGNDEVSFVKGWEAYRALLEERHDRIFAELCSPIGAFLAKAIALCDPSDPLRFFGSLGGILLSAGLWPARFNNSGEASARMVLSGDASELERVLFLTPLQEETYVKGLRPLSRKDVIGWIRVEILPMQAVGRAFLMGSFFFDDALIDSDLDLGIAFAEGLSEDDKWNCIAQIREKCLQSLGRKADIKEILALPSGALFGANPDSAEEVRQHD